MTLALTVIGRETIWVVVDRRLSYQDGTFRDNASKVMALHADDGAGFLIYAGLGATARGTEPSAWMSATLRGQGWLFENALGRIAEAANAQLPSHLKDLPGGRHVVLAPMFYNDGRARMFGIENLVNATGQHASAFVTVNRTADPTSPTARIATVGSGAFTLVRNSHFSNVQRSLHSLIKNNDEGKVSDSTVAARLAKLCFQVHQRTTDGTVGPRSIVAWHRRPGSKLPGGGAAFYDGLDLEDNFRNSFPMLMAGLDVQAMSSVMFEDAWGRIERGLDPLVLNNLDLQRKLSEISHDPDDRLR